MINVTNLLVIECVLFPSYYFVSVGNIILKFVHEKKNCIFIVLEFHCLTFAHQHILFKVKQENERHVSIALI